MIKNNTSYKNVSSFRGYYNGHFLRSYNEFLYALYVEYIENNIIIDTEPFKLNSEVTGKSKLPDFMVKNSEGKTFLVEIKGTKKEIETLIVDYAIGKYDTFGHEVKFFTANKKLLTSLLKEKLGKDKFNQLSAEYKSQRLSKFYPGFPNELNPMYGKRHSVETIQKIKNNLPNVSGKNNPMYGKSHSIEAKIKIGKKWKDPAIAKSMVLKGLATAMKKLDKENTTVYLNYTIQVLTTDIPVNKPHSINNYIAITEGKLNKYFGGSKHDYLKFIKEILCQR